MKNIIIGFLVALICIIQNSCTKTPAQNDLDRVFAEQFQFNFSDTITNFYFKGILDNQKISYSDGVDNYSYVQEISTNQQISGNSFSTSNTSISKVIYYRAFTFQLPIEKAQNRPNSWLRISLTGPSSTNILKTDSILRLYLDNKANLSFTKHQLYRSNIAIPSDSLGFSLNLTMLKYINDYSGDSHFIIETYQGDQTGSFLKIKEVQKEVGLDIDTYYVTFNFQCKLYFDFDYSSPFRTLNDGEMRIRIVLPR